MAFRKRVPRSKKSFRPPKRQRGGPARRGPAAASTKGLLPEEERLLALLYQKTAAKPKELAQELGLGRQARRELPLVLQRLCQARLLSCKGEVFRLHDPSRFVEGTITVHPRGFGFAKISKATDAKPGRDLFIPPPALGSARHGDRALLAISGQQQDRLEGRVLSVLERATNLLVGTYQAGRPSGLVIPEDERFPFTVLIPPGDELEAADQEAVVVEITDQPPAGHPVGRVVEVLGDPSRLEVQTDIVLRKFGLPHTFSPEALQQAAGLEEVTGREGGREDLREVFHVTIDSESARDFDDAVAVQTTKAGYRLVVSIADVSHYVEIGTPLDREAYERGTSVYFPTRVVPMLPERLSNQLCSLVPEQDRLAFTAILDFDRHGKRVGKRFCKSIIRSHHRLTYTLVKQLLVDEDPALRRRHPALLEPLATMAELAGHLQEQRRKRGSIGFEIPEPLVVIGPEDTVGGVVRTERNLAHRLIEEFMLAANEAVAENFSEQEYPALYRIHEVPDPEKVREFADFARGMGLDLPEDTSSPRYFGKVLERVQGKPTEYIVNNLLLRTMKQAAYSPKNVGHFGLAAAHYTHFTSPIRRYPDLMVHRALQQLLSRVPAQKVRASASPLEEAAEFLSGRERVAITADREMVDRLKVRWMAEKLGETFEGVISGVTQFGLFVELLEMFVSGAIPVAELQDDYYHLDEKHHRYQGERTGRSLQLGDLVRVRVANVNIRRRRVDFELLEKLDEPGQGNQS